LSGMRNYNTTNAGTDKKANEPMAILERISGW
jgi:hypothetical protein